MRRGTVLILGLVCLAGLLAYGAIITAPAIQSDIQERTAQVLAASDMDFVDVRADGRDVVITGAAPDPAARDEVVGLSSGLRGVRLVRDEMTVLDPPVSPFTFSALAAGDGISLSGFVPDEATKTALAEQARSLFDGQVNDDTIIARGVPDAAWGDAVAAALAQLPRIENGELAVQDRSLTLSGTLESEPAASAVENAMIAALPEGYSFQPSFDVPPPLIVDEPAPPEGQEAPAEEEGGDTAASNEADEGVPPEADGPEGADETLPAGTDADEDAATETPEAAEAATGGDAADGNEAPAGDGGPEVAAAPVAGPVLDDPARCQDELDALLDSQTIRFASSSAVISSDSYALLNELGEVAGRCTASSIAIEGHTDSSGALQANIDLSLARAQAVMEYLIGLGMERERLSAYGYGPTLPVSSNETEAGRAQNRRIEFKVEQ